MIHSFELDEPQSKTTALDLAVVLQHLLVGRGAEEAARLEFGTKPAVDALRDAAGRDLGLLLRNGVDDELPRRARLGAGLPAESAARNEHYGLRVREALVHHRRILTVRVTLDARAVRPLGRDEMLDAVFMADEMDAHPVREIQPLPVEAELPDRRMLGKENALLPLGARLLGALVLTDRRARRVRDLAPRPLHFHELDRCHGRIIP